MPKTRASRPAPLTPGTPTVPWVVWSEDLGNGTHGVFVARLVGGDHFELFNGGAPVSNVHRDAVRPDITFFGNVPYISWIEPHGNVNRGFVGHFENGVFRLDTPLRDPLYVPVPQRAPDRRSGAAVLQLHVGSVHQRRRRVPAGRDQRPVLPVHD